MCIIVIFWYTGHYLNVYQSAALCHFFHRLVLALCPILYLSYLTYFSNTSFPECTNVIMCLPISFTASVPSSLHHRTCWLGHRLVHQWPPHPRDPCGAWQDLHLCGGGRQQPWQTWAWPPLLHHWWPRGRLCIQDTCWTRGELLILLMGHHSNVKGELKNRSLSIIVLWRCD